eukprot:jgi/Botrbrau1/15813/Bobra.40_1s0002.1
MPTADRVLERSDILPDVKRPLGPSVPISRKTRLARPLNFAVVQSEKLDFGVLAGPFSLNQSQLASLPTKCCSLPPQCLPILSKLALLLQAGAKMFAPIFCAVFVDTVGDASKWQAKLSDRYRGITFVVCPKADALYSIVSAASIVAKVTRDRELKGFICKEAVTVSTTFGTGYPADPETVAWLKQHLDPVFGFPSLVRFSWQTCTRLLDDKGAKVKWECDEEGCSSQMCLTFGGKVAATKSSSGAGRHSFFRARKLQRVV